MTFVQDPANRHQAVLSRHFTDKDLREAFGRAEGGNDAEKVRGTIEGLRLCDGTEEKRAEKVRNTGEMSLMVFRGHVDARSMAPIPYVLSTSCQRPPGMSSAPSCSLSRCSISRADRKQQPSHDHPLKSTLVSHCRGSSHW